MVLPASSRSETLGCNSTEILDIPKPIPNHVRSFEMCLSFFFPNTELVSNLIFKLLHPIFYKCLLNCPPQLRVRGARLPLLRLRWHRHLSVRGHHALCRPFRQYFFCSREVFHSIIILLALVQISLTAKENQSVYNPCLAYTYLVELDRMCHPI